MLLTFLVISVISLVVALAATREKILHAAVLGFFILQAGIAAWSIANIGRTEFEFFTFDTLGIVYFVMMSAMGLLCAWKSIAYLDEENLRQKKIYFVSLIMLDIALAGVYFSNNIAVSWIFLEATTVATTALIYHRRSRKSLEATWKYIFVSSVGIAIAYLGILMFSTVAHSAGETDLSYRWLHGAVAAGNPVYLKLAFIFILVGYSAKMELFPLYSVGVDANHASPAPASAFLSSAMAGGGFVAVFRVYRLMEGNPEVMVWGRHVMLLAGVLSLLVAAVYMGRTNNYKRLLAYSTVENSGLMALGLGLGGLGVWAAVLHSMGHTIIKGVMFLQISVAGKMYGTYKIGRIGNYYMADGIGSLVLACGVIGLLALPPSILFRSEYLMLTEGFGSGLWWLMIPVCLLLIVIMYWISSRILPILGRPMDMGKVALHKKNTAMSTVLLCLLAAVFVFGLWQSPWLVGLIDSIVK